KTLDQVHDRGGGTLGLDVGQGVATIVDEPAKFTRFGASRGRAPVGKSTDGVAALAPGLSDIVQDERPASGGGDADAESAHLGVIGDFIVVRRAGESFGDGVRETLWAFLGPFAMRHRWPSCVRRVSVQITLWRVQVHD